MAVTAKSKILASDVSGAIKSITRSGTTFTYTCLDGSTGTFTQQDNNTTYSAATSSALGLVKIGSNISVSSGTISLSKANVTSALGYTPPSSSSAISIGNCASSVGRWNHGGNLNMKAYWGVGTFGQGSKSGETGGGSAVYATKWTAPSGGTWGIFMASDTGDSTSKNYMKTISGGTAIDLPNTACFMIRIA